jgi:NAD(P)-dependent dehydrogenase (short-subunit alcohol dehydrogenase family)
LRATYRKGWRRRGAEHQFHGGRNKHQRMSSYGSSNAAVNHLTRTLACAHSSRNSLPSDTIRRMAAGRVPQRISHPPHSSSLAP